MVRSLLSILVVCASPLAAACPNPPVASVGLAKAPGDVCIPEGFTDLTIDFFDDFSWKSFLATVRLFEQYHPLWEVFHEDGSAPGNGPEANACSARVGPSDMVLASFSGYHDIGQTFDGSLSSPIVAQNGRYVHYLTSYNEIAYQHILKNRWYLRSELPVVPVPRPAVPVLQFPVGAEVVKSAWVEMQGFTEAQRKRVYTRTAVVKDPASGKCASALVGLLGIHIVRKTASRPQWIWSSFEQADLVPGNPDSPGYLLHDGTDAPMPAVNPLSLIPPAPQPVKPFNVSRSAKTPIHPQTAQTNAAYRKLLDGTIWKNYRLAVTQWPLAPGDQSVPVDPSQAGSVFQTFPGDGATSAFSNLTMETFQQARAGQGCMNCHNRARLATDFLYSVLMHAYPAKVGLPGRY